MEETDKTLLWQEGCPSTVIRVQLHTFGRSLCATFEFPSVVHPNLQPSTSSLGEIVH